MDFSYRWPSTWWNRQASHQKVHKDPQGPASLTVFPSQFKFDGNFVPISPRFLIQWSQPKFCMWHDSVAVVECAKKLLRSDGQQWNYSKANFPSNWNCGQKNHLWNGPPLSGAPRTTYPVLPWDIEIWFMLRVLERCCLIPWIVTTFFVVLCYGLSL